MNLIELWTRLEKSKAYLDLKQKNPDVFLCAGFFIMNFKTNIFEYNLDFRDEKKIYTFKIPVVGEIVMIEEEIIDTGKPLEKISLDVQIDIADLKEIVEKALAENNIKNKLEEVIAVLQVINNQKIWNLTIMCEGFVIINAHIDCETGKVLKFEKKNLFDFIKK